MTRSTITRSSCGFFLIASLILLSGCAKEVAVTPQPEATRDPNLEQPIEQQLQSINPAAVPVYQEATKAMDLRDYDKAIPLYEQVITMAPGFSTAYRRLGYMELDLNNVDQAEQLTRKALELESNSYNQSALALVLVQKDTPKDSQEAFTLASSAVKLLPDDDQALLALILSAAAVNNTEIMRTTNQHLLDLEPINPFAHYINGLLAADDGRWEYAESELLYAQSLGMPKDTIKHALDNKIARNAMISRLLRWGGMASAAWILGFGLLFLIGTILSRATIQAINRAQPARDYEVRPEEQRIRSLYRIVITVLSFYYYISIPFVILALFLVVGGAFYFFFLIGSIPVQLAIILVIMLFASFFAVLRSLFWRSKESPPGHLLNKIDAPDLWALVENVAHKLDVKPVDAIYVSPWASISVYETGSILQKIHGQGKRNLILGMGVLPALSQGQLAAILAHEYGHFSNRDTAGGNLAHQVYASLQQMAQRLIRGRAAQIFNPVWLFVLGYQRIYLRVTQGASRLQEILADRYAVIAYGSDNFIDGLKNIIRQSIAFSMQAEIEARKSVELNRPISNLYSLPMQERLQTELDKRVEEVMKHSTSQYDSHPSPQERISWVERVRVPYSPLQDNPSPALQLFPNSEALQHEMTALLMKNVHR